MSFAWQRANRLVAAGAAVALLGALGLELRRAFEEPPAAPEPTLSAAGDAPIAPAAEGIASFHLFGRAEAVAMPAAGDEADAAASPLRLVGLLSGAHPRALIAADGEDALYAPGDRLPGDWHVERIDADGVELVQGARRHRLRIDWTAPAAAVSAAPEPQPDAAAAGDATAAAVPEPIEVPRSAGVPQ